MKKITLAIAVAAMFAIPGASAGTEIDTSAQKDTFRCAPMWCFLYY